jgi:hypothetical protein
MFMRLRTCFIIAIVFCSRLALAQGGPPLITDDPGTPGIGKFELNFAVTFQRTGGESVMELPLIDFNYGLGDHTQLKYEVAYLILDEENAGPVGALSNSNFGIKWRFFDEDRHGIAISTYPQIEFNNPSPLRRDIIEEQTNFLLPFELAKSFGQFEIGGDIGYQFVQHADDQWIYGFALGYVLNKRLELLGEIHASASADFDDHQPLLNVGARYKLDDRFTLLFAAGRGLRDSDESPIIYAALQWHF